MSNLPRNIFLATPLRTVIGMTGSSWQGQLTQIVENFSPILNKLYKKNSLCFSISIFYMLLLSVTREQGYLLFIRLIIIQWYNN